MTDLYPYPYPSKPWRYFHGRKLKGQVQRALAENARIHAEQHRWLFGQPTPGDTDDRA